MTEEQQEQQEQAVQPNQTMASLTDEQLYSHYGKIVFESNLLSRELQRLDQEILRRRSSAQEAK